MGNERIRLGRWEFGDRLSAEKDPVKSQMNKGNLEKIERAVSLLSDEDLAKFRAWFAEFDAANWDRQFEEDVAIGKLDPLAEKALTHLRQGNCTNV